MFLKKKLDSKLINQKKEPSGSFLRIGGLMKRDDMIVTVYQIPHDGFYPTLAGGLELMIDAYTYVAYIEELQELYVSIEGVRYPKNKYIQDIMLAESKEMLYKDYVQWYKDMLNAKFPDAPVLATIELDAQGRPKPEIPEHLKPNDAFTKLRSAGLNFTIQR